MSLSGISGISGLCFSTPSAEIPYSFLDATLIFDPTYKSYKRRHDEFLDYSGETVLNISGHGMLTGDRVEIKNETFEVVLNTTITVNDPDQIQLDAIPPNGNMYFKFYSIANDEELLRQVSEDWTLSGNEQVFRNGNDALYDGSSWYERIDELDACESPFVIFALIEWNGSIHRVFGNLGIFSLIINDTGTPILTVGGVTNNLDPVSMGYNLITLKRTASTIEFAINNGTYTATQFDENEAFQFQFIGTDGSEITPDQSKQRLILFYDNASFDIEAVRTQILGMIP